MPEFQYILLTSEVSNFDCGNDSINQYVRDSYFATLLQQCYAYEIVYRSFVVGYYMITFRNVAFSDCTSEISDYQIGSFKEFIPTLYINYLAVGKDYQKNNIGTKTLEKIITEARQWSDFLPIRLVTINAVPDKVEWYKKMGFAEMGKDIDNVNKYMYIDLIKNKKQLDDYCDEKIKSFL